MFETGTDQLNDYAQVSSVAATILLPLFHDKPGEPIPENTSGFLVVSGWSLELCHSCLLP